MPQEEVLTCNSIKLAGIVSEEPVFSHNLYGEGFYIFKLNVPRLSSSFDILPITISERLVDKNLITVGKKISIEGQIRSYNNYSETEKRSLLVITTFCRDLTFLDDSEIVNNCNEIYLDGYICKPPTYRTTPFGREICDILLAVNRSYNKSDYIPCIAWGRNAKFSEKLNVGENIKIYGRLQSRSYQKKLSEDEFLEKTAYEISITKLEAVKSVL